MNFPYLISLLISAFVLIIGVVVHESAHALAAYALGDKTARAQGRVSLNPLRHIDPFGTVLMPLLMIIAGGPVFAFAKPVPVNLAHLKNPKRDEVLVSLAGPASNIALAVLFAVGLRFLVGSSAVASLVGSGLIGTLVQFFVSGITVNLSLAFFNLLPLPPLDGSSILVPFLHGDALQTYYRVSQYATPILIAVLYFIPSFLHIDLIGLYFGVTVDPLSLGLLQFALGM